MKYRLMLMSEYPKISREAKEAAYKVMVSWLSVAQNRVNGGVHPSMDIVHEMLVQAALADQVKNGN